MTVLIYDGSLEGLLCCIFEKYERRLKELKIVEENKWLPSPFDNVIHVISDARKAERVWKGLKKNLSPTGLHDFYRCFLSEIKDVGQVLVEFSSYILDHPGKEMEKDYGNAIMLKVSQVSRQVGREKHRFEAFVRFKATVDGIYFATIEPDFNILPLILNHFKKRYADQKWVIYDMKRNYGIFYDLQNVNPVVFDQKEFKTKLSQEDLTLGEAEMKYQALWQSYFKSTNIASRKNTKLQLQHLPRRYWKYLVELV